jgi:succinyl-CoA reductase
LIKKKKLLEFLTSRVESEVVTVNNIAVLNPRASFGSLKSDGFDGELSRCGTVEFVNIKSVRFYDRLIYERFVVQQLM